MSIEGRVQEIMDLVRRYGDFRGRAEYLFVEAKHTLDPRVQGKGVLDSGAALSQANALWTEIEQVVSLLVRRAVPTTNGDPQDVSGEEPKCAQG